MRGLWETGVRFLSGKSGTEERGNGRGEKVTGGGQRLIWEENRRRKKMKEEDEGKRM